MFVCNESIVSNYIGIVYLKVNNCSFFIYIKYVCFLRKFAQKEEGFRTGKQIRHRLRLRSPTPTPTPSPINWCPGTRPNNSSLIQPDLCAKAARNWLRRVGNRTIVRFPSPVAAAGARYQLGNRANNRRVLRLFWPAARDLPGNQSEQLFGLRPAGLKNEQKKPEREALAFSEQSPFLCD